MFSKEELARQLDRLRSAREAARALLDQTRGQGKVERSGPTIGRLTRMDALLMEGMSQLNRAQLNVRLQQIEAALAAHDAGRYGQCNRCKGPIARERLEALPEAPLCLACQDALETQP